MNDTGRVPKPDFFLGSTEHTGEFAIPRSCWVVRKVSDPNTRTCLLVRSSPHVTPSEEKLGVVLDHLILAPHYDGTEIDPISEWPLHVYVYLVLRASILSEQAFRWPDVESVAWGELYRSEEEALRAAV